jgi:hypothetical protein
MERPVLNLSEFCGQIASVVIIDQRDGADRFGSIVCSRFLFECSANHIAQGFRPRRISLA